MRISTFVCLWLVSANCAFALPATPSVYTGYDVTFSKAGFSDPTAPANQDMITPNVRLTRGGSSGLYNAASESFYSSTTSPAGTEWAFPHNNPAVTLSATDWSTLNFSDWETAFGGAGFGGPPSTVGQDAVVHLVDDDIYLDIRFTAWGQGGASGGSFSYVRAAVVPEPATVLLALGGLVLGSTSRRQRR